MNHNSVTLVGRLTRDPELRSTSSGKSFATFSIAVNRRFKPQGEEAAADFFNCKVWGQTAEYVDRYLKKGRLVLVQGRIETRKYNAKDGGTREAIDIVCDQATALDRAPEEGGHPSEADESAYRAGRKADGPRASAPPAAEDEYDPFADS